MGQLQRRDIVFWLLHHDFTEQRRTATGHRHFTHGPSQVKVSVKAHGPKGLSKKHTSMIFRALERAGFSRDQLRSEL